MQLHLRSCNAPLQSYLISTDGRPCSTPWHTMPKVEFNAGPRKLQVSVNIFNSTSNHVIIKLSVHKSSFSVTTMKLRAEVSSKRFFVCEVSAVASRPCGILGLGLGLNSQATGAVGRCASPHSECQMHILQLVLHLIYGLMASPHHTAKLQCNAMQCNATWFSDLRGYYILGNNHQSSGLMRPNALCQQQSPSPTR